jgi:S-disulfanyl-L-cysteine oxidoreductase SoxD
VVLRGRRLAAITACVAIAYTALGAVSASPESIMSGVFTEAQLKRGEEKYQSACASCHGAELTSSDPEFPSLTGPQFNWNWRKKTLAERLHRVRTTMPPNAIGSLSDQEHLDIIAYVLKANGYPAGQKELTPDPAALGAIIVQPPP